jgi:catalase
MIEPQDPISGVENVPDGEAEQIREIAELMVQLMEQRYKNDQPFLRGVHPKAHGCARATFTVKPGLPEDLRVGVFANPGVSYDAVVRFSNAAALKGPDVQDVVKDGVTTRQHGSRGMAVKVRGLPGTSLASDEPGTQDFLMVNSDVFPFANVADYLVLTRAQRQHNDKLALVFDTFGQTLVASGGALRAQTAGKISAGIQQTAMTNPLSSSYFSAAPFLFGPDRVMKFAVMPSPGTPDAPLPASLDDHYLRAALAERLRNDAASFDFAVQVRSPSPEAHVEDVTVPWKTADVPFRSVATIVIPKQEIDGPGADARCESLFWTPWHALPEHRPVGGINRLRLAVYQASIARRRQGAV